MKRLLFFASMVLVISNIFGQTNKSFGIKAGLNVANVSTNFPIVESGQESIMRYQAGVFFDIPLNNAFSFQPQLLYSGKGLKFAAGNHSHTIKMESLDLPLLVNFHLSSGFFLGVGPNLGYYLSGTNALIEANNTRETKYTFSGAPFDYKRLDVGLIGEIGYKHASGIRASMSYLKGLNNVAELPENTWKSDVFNFSLGYAIKL